MYLGDLLDDIGIGHDHSDQKLFKRITIAPNFVDSRGGNEDVFDIFGGDIFSLSQFEKIFSSINQFQTAIRLDFSNITGQDKT